MANILANRHTGDAERPGDRCPAQFCGSLEQLFFPLIVLSQENLYPLIIGLNVLNSLGSVAGGKPVYNLSDLGSLISVLPLLTAFIRCMQTLAARLIGGRS